MPTLYKPAKVLLANHPTIKEGWIRDRIADEPSILNLGDIILKDKERIQPKAGRLDLLLQDTYSNRRYEVEIQLGDTDESHIIRTIEYWDIERKRYPQYDHCAVLIAENITSRFLNVISLFNGHIPLIAIQMNAYKFNDDIALIFTTVLDEVSLGLEEEDEEEVVTDRNYWIKRGTDKTVEMVDEMLKIIKEFAHKFELKYNKFYIGLTEDGQANNFVSFVPRKTALNLNIRLPLSTDIQEKIEKAGIDDIGYDKKWNNYRLRLLKGDVTKHKELLTELFRKSFENWR